MQNTIGKTAVAPVNFEQNFSLSCDKCGHATVCVVTRKITDAFSQNFTEKTLPFSPEEVAKICKAFVSRHIINQIQTDGGT